MTTFTSPSAMLRVPLNDSLLLTRCLPSPQLRASFRRISRLNRARPPSSQESNSLPFAFKQENVIVLIKVAVITSTILFSISKVSGAHRSEILYYRYKQEICDARGIDCKSLKS